MLLPKGEIGSHWSILEPRILSAMKVSFGEYSLESIRHELEEGDLVAIIVERKESGTPCGVITYEVEKYPMGLALNIFSLSGKQFKSWVDSALILLEKEAARLGCRWIKAHGRPRWRNLSKKLGFTEHNVFVKKVR